MGCPIFASQGFTIHSASCREAEWIENPWLAKMGLPRPGALLDLIAIAEFFFYKSRLKIINVYVGNTKRWRKRNISCAIYKTRMKDKKTLIQNRGMFGCEYLSCPKGPQ